MKCTVKINAEMKKAVVLLFLLEECFSFDLPRSSCRKDLTISNDHYSLSDTYQVNDAYPTDAHYDQFGNLFFVESGRNSQGFYFDVRVILAEEITARKVDGLPEGISYSIAVDRKDTKVYFGTGHGIYSYNYDSCSAALISGTNLTLNMIFVDKDGNKYITESSNGVEELYLLDGVKKIRFHTLEALNELAIDDKNNFYFIKEEKLFVLKSTLSTPVCIGYVSYDGMAQITVHKENIFVASEKLVYFHENESVKSVVNVPGKVTAIAFDGTGDLVLGLYGKLLKYKKNECYLRNQKKLEED